jgi:predicted RNA-binding protein with PIN domain
MQHYIIDGYNVINSSDKFSVSSLKENKGERDSLSLYNSAATLTF